MLCVYAAVMQVFAELLWMLVNCLLRFAEVRSIAISIISVRLYVCLSVCLSVRFQCTRSNFDKLPVMSSALPSTQISK